MRREIHVDCFVQVVAAACQTTASLYSVDSRVGFLMTQTARSYLERVKEQMIQGFQPKYSGITKRCLISLGHIVRQGSKVLEAHNPSSGQVCTDLLSPIKCENALFTLTMIP